MTRGTRENLNRERLGPVIDGMVYVSLTILVWGVNALQRGLWQDDVQALGEAFHRARQSFGALFAPDPSPLRRLTLLPSALANATPHPIWTLHVLCAAIWLAQGLFAGWIVALLLPGRRWTRFAVVCLTLTATSDFTTASIVALAYNVAALLLLAAVVCALLWLRDGRAGALVMSAALLIGSLLTMDVALPAVPFLALLFLWWRRGPRAAVLLASWGIVLVPIAIVEWSFLHDPSSYAAVALRPMPAMAMVKRTIALWLENGAPWRWAFARADWYARPAAVIPAFWMAGGSLVAALLFLLRAHGKDDDAEAGRAPLLLASLFAMMALAANAAYAAVWFSELHYRTHILARIWAAAAIGILAGWAAMRAPRLRWLAVAVVTLFVFFGTWGGIERQDFYLASWRHHQRELASIVDAAPSLRPATVVILRSESTANRYLATEADYLTMHWLRLLNDTPELQTLRLDPQRGSECRASAAGLVCSLEPVAHYTAGVITPAFAFPFERLVIMDYDMASGTYRLVRSLRGDPLGRGFERDAERYRPELRIVGKPWTLRQRRLLLE